MEKDVEWVDFFEDDCRYAKSTEETEGKVKSGGVLVWI